MNPATEDAVKAYVEQLSTAGDISSKKMFGGFGLFESGVMFGLVNSSGVLHLKAGDDNRKAFEEHGATQHGRMLYFNVPADVLDNADQFVAWPKTAIAVAHKGKK